MTDQTANLLALANHVSNLGDSLRLLVRDYAAFKTRVLATMDDVEGDEWKGQSGPEQRTPTRPSPLLDDRGQPDQAGPLYPTTTWHARTLDEALDYIRSFCTQNVQIDCISLKKGKSGWEVTLA